MSIPQPLNITATGISALDQRKLPGEEVYIPIHSLEDAHRCIQEMVVRGAPLIGFTALWGMVIWLKKSMSNSKEDYAKAADWLSTARPTAVNLVYELEESKRFLSPYFQRKATNEELVSALEAFSTERMEQLHRDNLFMAKLAEQELEALSGNKKFRIMTICNTGYLACGPLGTALGVASHLHQQSKLESVFACETRPYLQGARLTCFELAKQGIQHRLVVEGAVAHVLKTQQIDAIFAGADRIAANGDTANKIGTCTLAIVADYYKVPFYIVAPTSSFDPEAKSGADIPIELRPESEITQFKGTQVAPIETNAFNPSFDVTPHQLIKGIFCEKGLLRAQQGVEGIKPAFAGRSS